MSKKPSAKTRRPSVMEATVKLRRENKQLRRDLEARNRDLTEALEQQTATSEILRVIAGSPTDLQSVLDAIAASAARLCDSVDAAVHRPDGDVLQRVAIFGQIPSRSPSFPISRDSYTGRAVVERQTIHIHDIEAESETDFPELDGTGSRGGSRARTRLAVPLLREGIPIGVISIRRMEVRPFTDKQIKLLETFADQAVIAIENVRLFNELKDSLEQQTATSKILGVIASSPTDIQPVLDVVAENAARVCDANDAMIRLVEGNMLRRVARHGPIPGSVASEIPIDRGSVNGRAVADCKTIHVHDLLEEQVEFPEGKKRAIADRIRTVLATPLLRGGVSIGVIFIRRTEVRPFTDKQIALLKTFADQAVIAIENVRLFKQLQKRNAELREALEHQTATSEVLSIISRSPTDVQPVLDAIVESAARVCGIDRLVLRLREGNAMVPRSHFGPIPVTRPEITTDEPPHFRWMRERGTLHIPDVRAQNDFPQVDIAGNYRTFLGVPLRQQGELIGILIARRNEVRPFTPVQIKLLETFADQAVIAIENVRLFNELKESLEQQTATSEILGVIASSPTDIQPVLDVVTENAARLCDATDAVIHRIDGDKLRPVANYGPLPGRGWRESIPIDRDQIPARAIINRQTLHIDDLAAVPEDDLPARFARSVGVRTVLATPMLREGIPIGTIHIRRLEVRPFTEKQIKLLETFAAQAVIAIENVRLFRELGERNAELREALEHQTATAEVLGIISRSPTDVQPVLDEIVESAARVCGIDDLGLRLREGNSLISRARFGSVPIPIDRVEISIDEPHHQWICEHGTLHVPDVLAQNDFPMLGSMSRWRTFLAVPLRQHEELIGILTARRAEVRPFTSAQIKLIETFADQAVIAIENVRLFKELQERNRDITEALEQQTATSEVLKVISRSVFDLRPVLETLTENAVRLCGAEKGSIYRFDGELLRHALSYNTTPELVEFLDRNPITPGRYSIAARVALERRTIHVPDVLADPEHTFGAKQVEPIRTVLSVPMVRGDDLLGVFTIWNSKVQPFTEGKLSW